MTILLTVAGYFAVLLLISRTVGRAGNDAFFRGNRQSPWPVVAFGMIGASISGVTFISVPGMARSIDMTYLQMCLGFFFGYLLVAFVLLPLYYKLQLTSIYEYLGQRFDERGRKTGAWFFLLSKMTGAAVRLYLVCLILQQYAFAAPIRIGAHEWRIPFVGVVLVTLLLIWLYTRRSGIRALVWTDAFQTFCLIVALVLILIQAAHLLGMSFGESMRAVMEHPNSRIFELTDWTSRQHFVKQFLSGVFIVIVMTGLDQDMMQKNLTCRTLRDGQKDLCSYGILFLPVNFLFLALGVLLLMLYAKTGVAMPAAADNLLPEFVASGRMGTTVLVLFTIGIVASAFSSADSALTALTTSFCIDILGIERQGDDPAAQARAERVRKIVHVCMMLVFIACILFFKAVGSTSVIDAVYVIASYTYGPLLGLFAFGMLTRRRPRTAYLPAICIAAPLICYAIDTASVALWGYKFGYELLLLNGLLTFAGLWASSVGRKPVLT
jgi:Na+/proline symporter